MKLVAIIGSPRGMAGNTGILLEALLAGAREAGAEVQVFSLANMDVKPCVSCEHCHITGDCPISDDFDMISTAIAAADGVLLGSPNYIISVTAQMKAFLDRCSKQIHTQEWVGKYAAAVVTSGSSHTDVVAGYLSQALRVLGFTTVGSVGALGWQVAMPDQREPHLANAAALGHALVNAIHTQQTFPEQAEERAMLWDRMQHMVMRMQEHWPYEYAYWMARVQ